MEDIVALEVALQSGVRRYFLTWGRLFDPVDPTSLIESARAHMSEQALGGEIKSIRVCDTLQVARDQPYFFEALFALSQTKIPRGDGYEDWRGHMRERLKNGHELYFLGQSAPSRERSS